ncbi:hypothetical protein HPS54_06940 [Prevotella sp. PCHR]|uniref:IgGFc-binding protein N-terminal domain-containing protein n=1 Tax=Xylanibacter caecicola TaxID=2736294 RepID=A0ABX2B1W6_9BACT|nr:hypothetical protein [Xylanibacter caecicola]NPE25251.1 hypothetical protein [Xylanibacter caecicola]
MKTITFLIVLFLQIFCLKSIYAQGVYEKVTSDEQIGEGGIFIIVRIDDNVSMGKIEPINKVSVGKGIKINVKNMNLLSLEKVNTDDSPFEIEIIKDMENVELFYIKTIQGYLYSDSETSTDIEYSTEYNKANKYKWSIEIGKTDNRFVRISNKSTKRIINYSTQSFRAMSSSTNANIQLFRKISVDNPIKLQIGAAKYSTLYYSDKNLVVPDEVEAYTFNCNNEGLQIGKTYKAMDIIPKGTAVVLHGQGSYDFLETVATGVTDPDNVLNGTDNNEIISDDNNDNYLYYMLSLNSSNDLNSVGFYWGTEEGRPFTNNAHKAYLKIPKSDTLQAKSSFLFSDIETETTAISRPIANDVTDTYYYTIQGNKISCPTNKGIYIRNGKKFVIK